jgi:uncharacterized spore protein YtfJ
LERIAEKLGVTAKASTVYSEPIERDGTTVIPVAKVRFGVGGGGGVKAGQRGSGGGGGMKVTPLGYIEIKQGEAEYKPIREPSSYVPVILAGGVAGCLVLRALRKIIR